MILKRKRRGPVTLPTASMGDIAFLLIIFFMVCSNFAKESNIKYKPPEARDVDAVRDAGISIVMDTDGKIYLNGHELAEGVDSLKTELEGMMKGKTNDTMREVLFKCDLDVTRKVFEPAMSAIIGAGGIVVAVGDKRKRD